MCLLSLYQDTSSHLLFWGVVTYNCVKARNRAWDSKTKRSVWMPEVCKKEGEKEKQLIKRGFLDTLSVTIILRDNESAPNRAD